MSKNYIGRLVKEGLIKAHTNAIKSELTNKNKLQRLNYSLNALVADSESKKINFSGMYNVVHINEKLFYMSRATERYYMLQGEAEPHRTCKIKKLIPKVMFMCGVSRPQYSTDGQLVFYGKIAIKAKWPLNACKDIIIQQDNIKPHISNNDPDFRAVASSDGFNIILVYQPPNNPDTNINDLGWFRAIQSLQVDTNSYNVDDLVKNVMISFQNLSPVTLNNVFFSLQSCLVEIMKVMGSNYYLVPHMGKARLIRQEMLPISLEVDEELIRECIQHLMEIDGIERLTYDIGPLMSFLGD